MTVRPQTDSAVPEELKELRLRLQEAEDTLEAIRMGGVDALVVFDETENERLFTLQGADRIYRLFLDSMGQGALTLNEKGMILYANAAAVGLLSSSEMPLVGSDVRGFVRREDRRRFDSLLKASHEGSVSTEIRLRGPKGGLPAHLSLRTLLDHGDTLVIALLTDLSEQKRTEGMIEKERLARSILAQAGEAIIVCDEHGTIVRASRAVARLAGRDPLFVSFDAALPLFTPSGDRFSLHWGSTRRSIRGQDVLFSRPDGAAFRLLLNANALHASDRTFLGTIVTLTDVTPVMQAHEAAERLLHESARSNRELAAIESLSLAGLQLASVDQLTHSIVSQLASSMEADQAMLLLLQGNRLKSVACVPPLAQAESCRARRGSGFVGTVAAMRRTLFIEDIRSSRLRRRSEVPPGITSLLGSPLLDGQEVMGVLYVGWREPHETDAREQRFLEIIASRAVAGIKALSLTERLAATLEEIRTQNEGLVESREALRASETRYRGIVESLQEHFVHELAAPAGLELAVVSEYAGALELIGGDFHDVIELSDGTVAVLVGDVEGKGVKAAGLTETVRAAVEALATVSPSSRYCLNHVNRMLLNQDSPQFCTALMMTIDPATGEALIASAGHPPPVLMDEEGARIVELRFGPPLGTFEWDYEQVALHVKPGATLVAYTDGLTEARRQGRLFGEQGVLKAVAGSRDATPEQLVQAIRTDVLSWTDSVRDDIQVLALRFPGERQTADQSRPELRLTVPHVLSYLGDVRGSVRDFLSAHGVDPETIEDMVLCVEEACTNALRHSATPEPAQLKVWFEDDSLMARIRDMGIGLDVNTLDLSSQPDPSAIGGRGVYLMSSIADELEVVRDQGTNVTIRIRL